MADYRNLEKELEREREKLNNMINEARKSRQPSDNAILEQSRRIDALLEMVQRACPSQRRKMEKSKDDRESR